MCIWLTGRPCSGKTTIALALYHHLTNAGHTVTLLDADHVRPILCPDLGFSEQDRLNNLRRIAFVAREIVRHRGLVITATVSPFAAHREIIRASFNPGEFIQVYVKASPDECERRDVKGMYARAKRGEISDFTGITSPYEEPLDSEVECDTQRFHLSQCVEKILLACPLS
jgi:adenylyl-sulfate kinase